MHREWTIYKITNPAGGIYIGRTCDFNTRMSRYRRWKVATIEQHRVEDSFRQFGFDNHVVDKIDQFVSDKDYADSKEMFWIRSYMSNFNKWPEMSGLNLTDGGISSCKRKEGFIFKQGVAARKKISLFDINGAFIKEYSSISEASAELGIGRDRIKNHIYGRLLRKPRKYIFKLS